MRKTLITISTFVLTACTSTYKEPDSAEPVAYLNFEDQTEKTYAGQINTIYAADDGYQCKILDNHQKLQVMASFADKNPLSKTIIPVDLKVLPNPNFKVKVQNAIQADQCSVMLGFKALEAERYKITFNSNYNRAKRTFACEAKVYQELNEKLILIKPNEYTICRD